MPLKKNRPSEKQKKNLDENKNENVALRNLQQSEIVGIKNENNFNSIEIDVDECEDEPSISISSKESTSESSFKKSKSSVNFNDSNYDLGIADVTVRGKPIYFNNNNESITKMGNKHLEQFTNTNIGSHNVEEDNNPTKTGNSRLERLFTTRESDNVWENPIQENESNKPKYDLSIYDYDEDSSDELQKKNAVTKCKLCTFTAETPMDLLKHKREAHKVQKKILPPQEIQKYFNYPDRTFCPICERPIKTRNFRSLFIKHLSVHTAVLTFECRICKKKFRRLDQMRAHEKRHVLSYAELRAIEETVDNNPLQFT